MKSRQYKQLLYPEKNSGPDLVNNRILTAKKLANVLTEPRTDLFNTTLSVSTVPDIWKRENVTPIHKKILQIRSVNQTSEKRT